MQRHLVSRAPDQCAGYCATFCGLPVVADSAKAGEGRWEPAYLEGECPTEYRKVPLCPACDRPL